MKPLTLKLLSVLAVVIALSCALTVVMLAEGETFTPAGSLLKYTVLNDTSVTVYGWSGSGQETLDIPESVEWNGTTYAVTQIDTKAFKGDTVLKSLTVPKTVQVIRDGAFENCVNLQTLNFASDSQLSSIGAYAFAYTGSDEVTVATIDTVTLPKSVTSLGYALFYNVPVKHFALEDGSLLKDAVRRLIPEKFHELNFRALDYEA